MSRDHAVAEIARRALGIQTLEARGRDHLDFHSLAVWDIRDALGRAYEAGRQAGPPTRCRCPACGREITITPA